VPASFSPKPPCGLTAQRRWPGMCPADTRNLALGTWSRGFGGWLGPKGDGDRPHLRRWFGLNMRPSWRRCGPRPLTTQAAFDKFASPTNSDGLKPHHASRSILAVQKWNKRSSAHQKLGKSGSNLERAKLAPESRRRCCVRISCSPLTRRSSVYRLW